MSDKEAENSFCTLYVEHQLYTSNRACRHIGKNLVLVEVKDDKHF